MNGEDIGKFAQSLRGNLIARDHVVSEDAHAWIRRCLRRGAAIAVISARQTSASTISTKV
jgi:hypothetical protein